MTQQRRARPTFSPLTLLGQKAGLYTVKERADAVDLTRSYVVHIERGAVRPSAGVIGRMAEAYKVSVEQIEKALQTSRANLARRIKEQDRVHQ